MRTHTTYTDLRRIMRLHNDGCTPEQIAEHVPVDISEIEKCIAVRTKKTRSRKKVNTPVDTPVNNETPESA